MIAFRRRQALSLMKRLRQSIWPQMGIQRYLKCMWLNLLRVKASPYSLAAGLSTGAAISFTPFLGGHLILSLVICWLIRANLLAGTIGTLVGNPWTFPIIWLTIYHAGTQILHLIKNLNIFSIPSPWLEKVSSFEIATLLHDWERIFWPMFIGSLPVVPLIWSIFFITTYVSIKKARQPYQRTNS